MDFTLDEQPAAVRDLARQIFADRATPERIRVVEESETRVDADLWAELATTGLLGVPLPEEHGGAGLGLAGLCALLAEQGRRTAPVPLWASTAAALAVASYGTPEQRRDVLPEAAEGTARLTVALEEFGSYDPGEPECAAHEGTGGWTLSGTKAAVPSPFGAGRVLVAARAPAGTGLFLVDADADGVTWRPEETTSRDLAGTLMLTGAPAAPVGSPGDGALDRTVEVARTALAALQVGVARGALRRAAGYLAEREQFRRPLATFQAVQHQLADCYIETEAMWVCVWDAVTAIEGGGPAAAESLVAKWWADQSGLDVVHRVQHVHGGIGVDVDYPVHRHFLWGKQISGTLGGAAADLARLGDVLAEGLQPQRLH